MKEYPEFYDVAPDGFDRTGEIAWLEVEYDCHNYQGFTLDMGCLTTSVLCQKWNGAFRDVWVRVPLLKATT